MKAEDFCNVADLLPHPMFMAAHDGTVLAANEAAKSQFGVVEQLADVFAGDEEELKEFLRMSSRVRKPVVGAFRTKKGGHAFRGEGALLTPRTAEATAVLGIRLVPGVESVVAFKVLNSRLENLRNELAMRNRLHAQVNRQKEWLRVTLMSIGDAVIATDAGGRIELMNAVAQALTGWDDSAAIGRPLAEVFNIVNEDSRQPVPSPVERVLREGITVGLANHTVLISRAGKEWPIDDTAAPIRDENGELLGAVLVFHEISDRRHLEAVARARLDQLTESNRRKDEFLAMLAHELRNPLAPILSAAAILKRTDAAATVQRTALVVERQAKHMSRMVDDLLDVSRITRGKIELHRQTINLADSVANVIENTQTLLQQRGHKLETALDPQLPKVSADSTRIEQVIGNLVNNAVKFTPEGGSIRIETGVEHGLVFVRVRDSGIGIDQELQPRIFDLFTQGDSTLHRTQGGLGIGLTIVKQLVELHGGHVTCSSEGAGAGSTFEIQLPQAADQHSSSAPRVAPVPTGRTVDVLLVDDNIEGAELLAHYLQTNGHRVIIRHDGPSAVEAALRHRPDVALLDIGLPGIDGYEVARRLRRAPTTRKCVLIALTGYGQAEAQQLAAAAGFNRHLTKPVDPQELSDLLARLERPAWES
jgi:PAS domain S-box-containing protein